MKKLNVAGITIYAGLSVMGVGEVENATKALTLAKTLRPDIAVIDSCLPNAVGLDVSPIIYEQMPEVRVILVNNLDANVAPENACGLASEVSFYRKRIG